MQVLGIEITLNSNSYILVFQKEKHTEAGRVGLADVPHTYENLLVVFFDKEHVIHG